jgi:Mn-dependent DtxR family transcriptional regulator
LQSSRKSDIKGRVISLLERHPEGLTVVDMAKALGVHRHTLTKYVYQLVGEGTVSQRLVGVAKLCYLAKKGKR